MYLVEKYLVGSCSIRLWKYTKNDLFKNLLCEPEIQFARTYWPRCDIETDAEIAEFKTYEEALCYYLLLTL